MKSSRIPVICGISLAAASAAGFSHWWSVRQFMAAVDAGIPVGIQSTQPTQRPPSPQSSPTREKPSEIPVIAKAVSPGTRPTTLDSHEKAFFEALTAKIEGLQNQNRDLLDQVAETNRDLMKLEFRVDTHSEQIPPFACERGQAGYQFRRLARRPPPSRRAVMLPDR